MPWRRRVVDEWQGLVPGGLVFKLHTRRGRDDAKHRALFWQVLL